jgi:hypothetical protein
MEVSIEIPIIMLCHITKTMQPLSLVVWSSTDPPKSNSVVLLGDSIAWFLIVVEIQNIFSFS